MTAVQAAAVRARKSRRRVLVSTVAWAIGMHLWFELAEPTDADLKKMSLIHEELERFGQQFELIATKAKGSA